MASCQDFSEKTSQNGVFSRWAPCASAAGSSSCYLVRRVGRQVLSPKTNSQKKKKTSVLLPIEKLLRCSKQIVALLKKGGPSSIHSTRSERTRTVTSWERSRIPSQRYNGEGSWGHLWRLSSSFFWSLWAFRHTPVKKFYPPRPGSNFGLRRPLRLGFNNLRLSMKIFQPKGLKHQELAPNTFVWSPNSWKHKSKVPKGWQKEFWSQSF